MPANRPVAQLVGGALTELLRNMAWTAIVVGLVIAGYAALLGPHRWAVAVRRRVVANSNPEVVVVGVGVLVLVLLLWWDPGLMCQRRVTALTAIGLIVGATVVFARALCGEHAVERTQ